MLSSFELAPDQSSDGRAPEGPPAGVEHLDSAVLHDLRNLLLVLQNQSACLLTRVPAGDEALRQLCGDLHATIECAVAVAKAWRKESRRLELADLLVELEPVLRASVSSAVHVEISPPTAGFVVFGDRSALLRALLNVCTNASASMPQGGRLRIDLASVHLRDPKPAHPRPIDAGEYARIAVRDTGEGMSDEQLAQAFDYRYSTGDGPNRGYGLTIAAEVLARHGGGIRASSEPGAGSVFELFVPLA